MQRFKILNKRFLALVVASVLTSWLLTSCMSHKANKETRVDFKDRLTDIEKANIKSVFKSPGFYIILLNDDTFLDIDNKSFSFFNYYKYTGKYTISSDSIIELWTENPGMTITLNYIEDIGESLLITFDKHESKSKDIPVYVGGTLWSVGINDSTYSAWQPLSDYKLSGHALGMTSSNQVMITCPGVKIDRIRFKSDDNRHIIGSSNFSLNLKDLSANAHLNIIDGRQAADSDKTPNVIVFNIDNLNIYRSPLRGKIDGERIIIVDNDGCPTDLELTLRKDLQLEFQKK